MVFGSTLSYAFSEVDSLINVFSHPEKIQNDHEKLMAYQPFLLELEEKEAFSELIVNSKKAIQLSEKLGEKEQLVRFLFFNGLAHQKLNDFQKALLAFDQVINLAESTTEKKIVLNTFRQISTIYQQLGDFQKAFDFQMKALEGFEKINNVSGICQSIYHIGTIFYYQKQFEKALEQYHKSLKLARQTNQSQLIYSCLGALGATYQELNDPIESLCYSNASLQLAEELHYDLGIAYALNNLGLSYLKMGNCKDAKRSIAESIKIKEKVKDLWGIMGSMFSLVKISKQCEQNDKIEIILLKVVKMSKELGSKSRELEAYEGLIDFYDQKNPALAYSYSKKFIALKDTVFNEKTVEEMGQSKQRYQLAKKENEISMLKAKNKILNVSKENQRLYVILYFGSTILFFVAIIWFFSRLKMQHKINQMLEVKNSLLNQKNEEIRIKNKQLEHSNEDLAQFAYVASHDLKEPLRMIHSYTSLLEKRYNDQLDKSGKEFMHFIVDAVDRMKTLLDDLLEYSRSGKQELPDTLVSVADMMVVVSSNLNQQIKENKGSLIVKNENLPAILAHKSQLMQLLQNLVSNGMKFRGERDPIIIVDCEKKEDSYVFSVQDNGIGISKNNQKKVFEMFRRLHTKEEYAGTGIGLATCKKIVCNMGGDIWVESEVGVGSTFFISIPSPSEEFVIA